MAQGIWLALLVIVASAAYVSYRYWHNKWCSRISAQLYDAHTQCAFLVGGVDFNNEPLQYVKGISLEETGIARLGIYIAKSLLKSKIYNRYYVAEYKVVFPYYRFTLDSFEVITTCEVKSLLSKDREVYVAEFGEPERA